MSEQAATAIPLIDLLRQVPRNHWTGWERQWDSFGRASEYERCAIGSLCHQAADRIGELEKQLAEARAEIERLRGQVRLLRQFATDASTKAVDPQTRAEANKVLFRSLPLTPEDTGVTNE